MKSHYLQLVLVLPTKICFNGSIKLLNCEVFHGFYYMVIEM